MGTPSVSSTLGCSRRDRGYSDDYDDMTRRRHVLVERQDRIDNRAYGGSNLGQCRQKGPGLDAIQLDNLA